MSQSIDSARVLRAIPARPSRCQPRHDLCGWRCEYLLGEGALTRVYAAHAPNAAAGQPAPYALKMLREPLSADARALAILRREAWIGQHVSHPHLAPTLASQTVDAPTFLVQPLLRGYSLAALLEAGQAPPLPITLWLARQAAEALAALDDAGWMHADIKPSSVFISPEAHVTLLDLGVAQKSGEPARLAERPVLGQTRYMAPEMFSATALVDIRADIYSLGAVLMEALVGADAHEEFGRQKHGSRARVLTPASLRSYVPSAPPRLSRLIGHMMASDPLRRPSDPRDLIDRLAALEIETFAEHLRGEA